MSFIFTEEWKEEAELIGELEKIRSELDDAKKEIEKLNIDIEARKEEKLLLIEDMNKYYDLYIHQQKEIERLNRIIKSFEEGEMIPGKETEEWIQK